MKANMSEEQKKLVKEVINGNKDKEVELKKNKEIFANYNRIKRKINGYLDNYLYNDLINEKTKRDFIKFIKRTNSSINKDEEYIMKVFYDNCTKAKLSYDNKNKTIKKTTFEFDELVKELKLDMRGDRKDNIVNLSINNAKKIGEKISKDADYIPFAKYLYDYFKEGIDVEKRGRYKDNHITNDPIFIIMREIDRDNSTNAWRYKDKRENFKNIYKYIRDKKNKFFERLSNGDPSLPDDLTSASGAGLKSISSKICKYLCEYIYGFHNYFINDSYIRKALPFYLESYGFDFKSIKINDNIVIHIKSSSDCDNLNYRDLHYILCQLLDKANEEAKTFKDRISPDELDRIIWYAYKSFT